MKINQVANVGDVVGEVEIQIGPQLLTVFSEQLYSSPNKAFEELVSNSWDAGANAVYIGFPDLEMTLLEPVKDKFQQKLDLIDVNLASAQNANDKKPQAIWVLDDGISMNVTGLQDLWKIALSQKRTKPIVKNRHPIGKFGVGKLATYLLAKNIVYICKAPDGVVRTVEVDYPSLVEASPGRLTSEEAEKLDVRSINDEQLKEILLRYEDGDNILNIINKGVPFRTLPDQEEEFGGSILPAPEPSGTWTLVLLTSLREAGCDLQAGRLRWMLRTSLPLSPVMSIVMNNEILTSTKVDFDIQAEWSIGPGLGISEVKVKGDTDYSITEHTVPLDHITIDDIGGPITGRVRLFKERLTGGKSDNHGPSHGFFVNILGRVINLNENHFGLDNLSHGTWPKTRITVRADWLDGFLAVSREALTDGKEVRIFRAFLLSLFNKARAEETKSASAEWPNAGDILTRTYGSVPLKPLNRVVTDGLLGASTLPIFITGAEAIDAKNNLEHWAKEVGSDPSKAITSVSIETYDVSAPIVRYDFPNKKVTVNRNHPFYREHVTSQEGQTLLRDSAFADLMTFAFMSDLGISDDDVKQIFDYKEDLLRLLAKVRRRTAIQLAELLLDTTDHVKGLERALDEALDHLGFVVTPMAQSGEPEGIAYAPLTPGKDHTNRSYKFTYDAKSTTHKKAKTSNLNVAGLARHRKKHNADYALVVAIDFEDGGYVDECTNNQITPMRAKDLAALLIGSATRGPINHEEFANVFQLRDANEVGKWVTDYLEEMQKSKKFSLGQFLEALSRIEWSGPDAITPEVISREARQLMHSTTTPTAKEIQIIVRGLEQIVPWFIRVEQDGHIVLNCTPKALRRAIIEQLAHLPPEYQVNLNSEDIHSVES